MALPLVLTEARDRQTHQSRLRYRRKDFLFLNMPELTWQGKGLAQTAPASLIRDSIIYPNGLGYPATDIENRLIFGENLSVMASLLSEYEGRINLIYADPPFFTNRKYPARIGRGEDSRKPDHLMNSSVQIIC